jgi:HlyD family secretion protein
VPQTYVKIVQPAGAGIVQVILVKEGRSVKAGDVLMRMDTRLAQADRKTLDTELALRSLQLRRIEAELTGKPLRRLESDTDELFLPVEAQHRDRRRAFEDALGEAREGLTRARRDHESAREVLARLREVTPLLKAQWDSLAGLGEEGYVARMNVRERELEYLASALDLRAQEKTVASLAAAAQAGIVKDLATHTVGAVVSPGAALLTFVPEDEPLLTEVMIQNDDVGFVHAGQTVKLKLAGTLRPAREAHLWRRWKDAVIERGIALDDETALLELAMRLLEEEDVSLAMIWSAMQTWIEKGLT